MNQRWIRDESYVYLSISVWLVSDHDRGLSWSYPYISYNPMEGLAQREISQRIDLLNYPLMSDRWIGDDPYLHLAISHFSVHIMIDLYHDVIPIYPITQWKVWLNERLAKGSIYSTSPWCPIDGDRSHLWFISPSGYQSLLYHNHDRGLSWSYPYISYNPMEGSDQREINQRIDLLNYPLMTDRWRYEPMTPISIWLSVTSLSKAW